MSVSNIGKALLVGLIVLGISVVGLMLLFYESGVESVFVSLDSARAVVRDNEAAVAVMQDAVESIGPHGVLDPEVRGRLRERFLGSEVMYAGYACKDQPRNMAEFVILDYPKTLRLWGYGPGASNRQKINGVEVARFTLSGPDFAADTHEVATYQLVVANARCSLWTVLLPAGLEIPEELPLIETLNHHLRLAQVDEAEAYLETLPDVDEEDSHGDTLLTAAAAGGLRDLVEDFLDRGSDIEWKDRGGWTALAAATASGHVSTVELLLKRGADPDARDNLGQTPMFNAAGQGNVDIMRLLKQYGATLGAASDKEFFGGGDTPLHEAALRCHADAVEWLLENGADVNAADPYGVTPLIGMASRECVDVAEVLIAHGADVNAEGKTGTALHWAANFGSKEVVELLVTSGARVSRADIQSARKRHRTEIAEYLDEVRRRSK